MKRNNFSTRLLNLSKLLSFFFFTKNTTTFFLQFFFRKFDKIIKTEDSKYQNDHNNTYCLDFYSYSFNPKLKCWLLWYEILLLPTQTWVCVSWVATNPGLRMYGSGYMGPLLVYMDCVKFICEPDQVANFWVKSGSSTTVFCGHIMR